jgi:lysophospholipase L1-like esterase
MKKILIALVCAAVMPFSVLEAQTAAIAANEKVEKVDAVTTVASTKGTKLYVVGDSTLSSFNDPYFYPRYGYGTKLQDYLDPSKIEVINLAMSGRSSLSFLSEANYQTLKNSIKKGDYLLIGFGHNDEKAEKSRYTNPNGTKADAGSFKNVLYENYIKLALEKKATPVLCTPIVRRAPGKAYEGSFIHIVADQDGFPGGDYPKAIRELGKECGVTVVDNTAITKALYEKLGDEGTLKLHAWLSHKPGSVDNTHLNTYGASVVAYQVVTDLAKQDTRFAKMVRKDAAEPTEAILVKNPSYNIPKYDGFAPTDKSVIWTTTAPWFATVFGDMGGAEKIANKDLYEITEVPGGVSMHSGAKDGSVSAGKIASASDGPAFYFQQIPVGKDFTLTATAKINMVGKNNQASFGLMVRDDIYIDKFDNTVKSDYVACGGLKIANGDGGWQSSFQRLGGTLTGTNATSEPCPAAGQSVVLTITKKGSVYTVQYGKEPPVTYTAELNEIDKQYVYAGLFTVRSAYVDFSTISLTVQ